MKILKLNSLDLFFSFIDYANKMLGNLTESSAYLSYGFRQTVPRQPMEENDENSGEIIDKDEESNANEYPEHYDEYEEEIGYDCAVATYEGNSTKITEFHDPSALLASFCEFFKKPRMYLNLAF